MKQTFTNHLGRVEEKLELGLEDQWIYVHYTKGATEKNACLLKNENKSEEEYLDGFFRENNVSEEMKKEVITFIKNNAGPRSAHWNEFTNFLMKALSLNMVFGIAAAISIYLGFKGGAILDNHYDVYPTFTLLGIFLGIGVGGLTVYSMVHKYFSSSLQKEKKPKVPKKVHSQDQVDYPNIEVTIDDVRTAIRTFSDHLPKGVFRTILVRDDHSIDFRQLAPLLGGMPDKNYYMSKETYDLFDESEKQIPIEMDLVQKAVDQFVKEHREYPTLKFDPLRRVNYYQLLQEHYLKKEPSLQFYITDLDGLITHVKPQKKHSS